MGKRFKIFLFVVILVAICAISYLIMNIIDREKTSVQKEKIVNTEVVETEENTNKIDKENVEDEEAVQRLPQEEKINMEKLDSKVETYNSQFENYIGIITGEQLEELARIVRKVNEFEIGDIVEQKAANQNVNNAVSKTTSNNEVTDTTVENTTSTIEANELGLLPGQHYVNLSFKDKTGERVGVYVLDDRSIVTFTVLDVDKDVNYKAQEYYDKDGYIEKIYVTEDYTDKKIANKASSEAKMFNEDYTILGDQEGKIFKAEDINSLIKNIQLYNAKATEHFVNIIFQDSDGNLESITGDTETNYFRLPESKNKIYTSDNIDYYKLYFQYDDNYYIDAIRVVAFEK